MALSSLAEQLSQATFPGQLSQFVPSFVPELRYSVTPTLPPHEKLDRNQIGGSENESASLPPG